jgi:hypothetical protein
MPGVVGGGGGGGGPEVEAAAATTAMHACRAAMAPTWLPRKREVPIVIVISVRLSVESPLAI